MAVDISFYKGLLKTRFTQCTSNQEMAVDDSFNRGTS